MFFSFNSGDNANSVFFGFNASLLFCSMSLFFGFNADMFFGYKASLFFRVNVSDCNSSFFCCNSCLFFCYNTKLFFRFNSSLFFGFNASLFSGCETGLFCRANATLSKTCLFVARFFFDFKVSFFNTSFSFTSKSSFLF